MTFDYSPFNPMIWGAFVLAWVVIWALGNIYRKTHSFDQDKDAKEE